MLDGLPSGIDYPVLTAAAQNLLGYYRDNYGIDLDGLDIDKPGKQKIPGDLAEVAVRRMDSKTGVVANLTMKAISNGTFLYDVEIPNIDIRTGVATGGSYYDKIIIFLGAELQIAVDRLKNNLFHNEEGIENCKEIIEEEALCAWMEKVHGNTPQYKDQEVYKNYPINLNFPNAPDDNIA